MGKTHEALLRAEKEYQSKIPEISGHSLKSHVVISSKAGITSVSPEWCQELRGRIQTQHPDGSIKTIMFTSTAHGSGSTKTAVGFAMCLAKDYQHKVLLIDANLRTPGLHNYFSDETDLGLNGLFSHEYQMDFEQKNKSNFNLYVITCNTDNPESTHLFETKRFNDFLKTMRQSYDYVILDAPPITHFAEARIISSKVDGVILIVEFGKTRRQVALKAKNELDAAGGNFLGVVLNRRKYYIPKWLYKSL
jgi:capsular exopolysaccharide synthesis family protein